MMKTVLMLMLGAMVMLGAAPAYSAEVAHLFYCQEGPEATEEKLEEADSNWLKAAKTMKGGDQFKAYVYYPLAAKMPGTTDLFFVVVAPSPEEWGVFWKNYKDSPAEALDIKNRDLVICSDSALMESVEVK